VLHGIYCLLAPASSRPWFWGVIGERTARYNAPFAAREARPSEFMSVGR
jgi:hypothetical protein